MILQLLAEEASENGGTPQYMAYIALAFIAVLAIIFFVVSGRKNKQRQKEYEAELAAITAGTKVKTIGGICGIVREVCSDNTFVIETGSEDTGKSFVKIDKTCIAQTDLHSAETPVTATTDDTTGTTDAQA